MKHGVCQKPQNTQMVGRRGLLAAASPGHARRCSKEALNGSYEHSCLILNRDPKNASDSSSRQNFAGKVFNR